MKVRYRIGNGQIISFLEGRSAQLVFTALNHILWLLGAL